MSENTQFIFNNYYKEIYFVKELINKKFEWAPSPILTQLDITKKKDD
jgi:hypothetical protein